MLAVTGDPIKELIVGIIRDAGKSWRRSYGDESFQAISCTRTDNQKRTKKTEKSSVILISLSTINTEDILMNVTVLTVNYYCDMQAS